MMVKGHYYIFGARSTAAMTGPKRHPTTQLVKLIAKENTDEGTESGY